MYCKNCGKEIETGEYCLDCKPEQVEQTAEQQVVANSEPKTYEFYGKTVEVKPDTSVGRGGAIAATILGAIAYFFSMFAYGFAMGGVESLTEFGYSYVTEIASVIVAPCIVISIIALIMGVIALVKGIGSIKTFKSAEKGAKPVATLILGIIGTVFAAMTLLFVLLTILMLTPFFVL